MKLILVVFGYIMWKSLLISLVGGDATVGLFLVQALYCRVMYFRDYQFFGSARNAVEITAEVVEWNNSNTIH